MEGEEWWVWVRDGGMGWKCGLIHCQASLCPSLHLVRPYGRKMGVGVGGKVVRGWRVKGWGNNYDRRRGGMFSLFLFVLFYLFRSCFIPVNVGSFSIH